MAEPRKVFRIEQTAGARLPRRVDSTTASPHHGEIVQALEALRALMAATPRADAGRDGEAAARQSDDLARIALELEAVSAGTAQATQKILDAAEEIDQLAENLAAALKGGLERELAQDISEILLRIFEACNFQDLIGQRVSKVLGTLKPGTAAVPRRGHAAPELHGPRLDGDAGHMTQAEIDALFDG